MEPSVLVRCNLSTEIFISVRLNLISIVNAMGLGIYFREEGIYFLEVKVHSVLDREIGIPKCRII